MLVVQTYILKLILGLRIKKRTTFSPSLLKTPEPKNDQCLDERNEFGKP